MNPSGGAVRARVGDVALGGRARGGWRALALYLSKQLWVGQCPALSTGHHRALHGLARQGTAAIAIAAVATTWKTVPFLTLIMLATLQSIPEALFRAARMDGAGLWARFRFVTLPHLRNTLIFAVVLQTIVSLQTFDLIFTLTSGGPGQGTCAQLSGLYQCL